MVRDAALRSVFMSFFAGCCVFVCVLTAPKGITKIIALKADKRARRYTTERLVLW